MAQSREVSDGQLSWLRTEVAHWLDEGLLEPASAAAIVARYPATRGQPVLRLLSVLGAAFVGAGLISLVASNVDRLSPAVRLAGVVAVWLGATAAAEALRRRQLARDGDLERSTAVGSARLIAVVAYGATIFQAAQSLQVPAYSSGLLACWAVGALAYAYACRGIGPLVVGIATLVGWYVWALGERADNGTAFLAGTLIAAVLAVAVGAAHEQDRPAGLGDFAAPWSVAGTLLALVALFGAALPTGNGDNFDIPLVAVAGVVVALLAAAGAAVSADRQTRREVAAVTAMLGAGLLLRAWAPGSGRDELTGPALLHALVATAVYLASSVWFAVVGAVRDRPQLTNLATAALVLFVTVQSFGVFAPLLSGAALFLFLGVVLLGVGTVAERGRRRLIQETTS